MSSVPRHPGQGLLASSTSPHHPQPERHEHPDRGLIHLVPVLAFALGGLAYPTWACYHVFTVANGDPATVPGAPYAAIVAGVLAFVAGVLIASFVTMLAYTVARLGRTRTTRVMQFVGLGGTLAGAVGGIALAFVVAGM